MVYSIDGNQFTRRKKIVLTGAGSGALSDYQLKLTAAYADAMQNDFGDTRFVEADMQTLIDAWLESKVDSTSADIWVEFPTTPADGVEETEAYMYFGNTGVASDWDGDATFLLYEDFEDLNAAALGGQGGWTETYNALQVKTTNPYEGSKSVYDDGTNYGRCIHSFPQQTNVAVRLRMLSVSGRAASVFVSEGSTYTSDIIAWTLFRDSNDIYYRTGGAHTDTGTNYAYSTWEECELIVKGNVYDVWYNGSKIVSDAPYAYKNPVSGPDTIGIMDEHGGNIGGFDLITTRKYAANPPTAAFGIEEHQRRTPMMI